MDARVANRAHSPRGVTAGLATAAALRAFGSAAAVAIAPVSSPTPASAA